MVRIANLHPAQGNNAKVADQHCAAYVNLPMHGLLEVEYNGKQHGTPAEEALMALLRLVTEVNPT